MPKRNRGTPFGSIIATPARGDYMGNRGCLHDEQGQIKRLYATRRWIICRLDFNGRQRTIMAPGRYTELFFLDEATALAAGHRPCAECMYLRYKQFTSLWLVANPDLVSGLTISASRLDAILHHERISPAGEKIIYSALLDQLPDGAFITLEPNEHPYLVLDDKILPWQPKGYGLAIPRPAGARVQVLTPRSIVRTLAKGYPVDIHASAWDRSNGKG